MINKNPNFRYSASLALEHPWITKDSEIFIPITLNENLSMDISSFKLSKLIRSIFFVGICSEHVIIVYITNRKLILKKTSSLRILAQKWF